MKKKLSLLVLVVLVLFFARYVFLHHEDFYILVEASLPETLGVALLYLGFLVVNGMFLNPLLAGFQIRLKFWEYTSISVLATFGNTFLPLRGGAGFRAVYLKSKYDFKYTYFLASLMGTYIIVFFSNSLIALFNLAYLYWVENIYNLWITALFLLIMLGGLVVLLFSPKQWNWIPVEAIRSRVNRLFEGWNLIRKSHGQISKLYFYNMINMLLLSWVMLLEFQALGVQDTTGMAVTFAQALFLAAIGTLSLFISITPASLGIREGLLMLSSQVVNVAPSHMLAIAIFDRVVMFSVLLVMAPVASYILKHQYATKESP